MNNGNLTQGNNNVTPAATIIEKAVFICMSVISGMLELGGVIYAIHMQLPVLEIVGVGLAYQIGNLVPNPFRINKIFTISSAVISIVGFSCLLVFGFNYLVFFVSFVFVAVSIQSIRALQKSNISTTIKRLFRIAGFIISPCVNGIITIIAGIVITMISLITYWPNKKVEVIKPKINILNFTMIIHQMHYFSYTYFILIIIGNILIKQSIFLIGIVFSLGWLSYVSVPHLLRGKNYRLYLIVGHLYLTAILILLALATNDIYINILWVLTGFGGGTVFCIEKICANANLLQKKDIVFTENIGHILGVLAGMTTYLISGSLTGAIYLSAIFALITALLTLFSSINTHNFSKVKSE